MAKPTDFPDFATDTNYTVGPDAGTATKVKPTTAELAEGHKQTKAYSPVAQGFNWWKNNVGLWVRHFEESEYALKSVRAALSQWQTITTTGTMDETTWDETSQRRTMCDVNATFAAWVGEGVASGFATSTSTPDPSFAVSATSSASGNGIVLISFSQATSTTERILRSADGGDNWTLVDLPLSRTGIGLVFWTGSVFMVIETDRSVYTSATGATGTWSAGTSLAIDASWGGGASGARSAENGGTLAVLISDIAGEKTIVTDDDGATWTVLTSGGTGIVFSEQLETWVRTDIAGGVSFASDPAGTWTPQTLTIQAADQTPDLSQIGEMGGVLVAKQGNAIVTSLNGLAWKSGLHVTQYDIHVVSGHAAYINGATLTMSGSV